MVRVWAAFLCALLPLSLDGADLGEVAFRPEVAAFVTEMVKQHGFERIELEHTLARARVQGSILRAISTPGTAKSWLDFRPIYVNPQRISGGVKFWDENAETLSRARAEYGVPEEIIVAVIGVETNFGKQIGTHRVLDALYTLAFDYPPRENFFRGELEQYLLFVRENGPDLLGVKGSYAGAMGIPQFMPSSARRYAVDFDRNGRIDLWTSASDSIGSVANYLRTFGWQAGESVMVRAEVSGEGYKSLIEAGIKPQRSVAEMAELGVQPAEPILGDRKGALFRLDGENGPEFWLGFENFYALTRYNRSVNYATAVNQLAEEIKSLRDVERQRE
jgi:peptidoglycan lytic transglycosylase B